MSIGLVRKIRARKGCASGVHVKFHKPASKWTAEKEIIKARYSTDSKASQERLTLSYAARHVWTGWMPWAGTYVETREQGLLAWWKELQIERSKISTKRKGNGRTSPASKQSGKRKSSKQRRNKKVVAKSKRNNKRAKARTF